MYLRIAGILFPIVLVAMIGLGIWGYAENQEKNTILINAENQYQRAFHDLTYHIDQLHDELSKSLAMNSRAQLSPNLTTVWRLSYAAQSDVGQLPLTLMPFNKTEEFLSKIADFSHEVAMRDLDEEPLNDEEWKTLTELHKRSKEIQDELQKVRTKVLTENLRWMDVELALAAQDKTMDNTIVDGFKTVDKKVEGYDELNWGTTAANMERQQNNRLKNIKGEKISKEQAKQKALQFLGLRQGEVSSVTVHENGKGTEYQSYSVTVRKQNQDPIQMDITQKGGHVIWMMNEREIDKPKINFEQARQKALQHLKKHGFENMEITAADRYEQLAVFTAVYTDGGVRIYPDAVTVKVALDNGEVTGFQAEKYLLSHVDRNVGKAKISRREAIEALNGDLQIRQSRMALIDNHRGEEVLCYEFITTRDNQVYRIFINAETGEEEEVELLKDIRL